MLSDNTSLSKDPRFVRLLEILHTVADLKTAAGILSWDRDVNMPRAAGKDRAGHLATLSKLRHEMFTTDEVGNLLDEMAQEVDLDSLDDIPSLIRVTQRDYANATKLPSEFVGRMSEASSNATMSWRKAKEDEYFGIFRDDLRRVVDLTIEKAELLGYEQHRYDALLNQFEPEMRTSTIASAFEELKKELIPVVEAIANQPPIDDGFLYKTYDSKKQWDFGVELLRSIGFDFDRGRVDYAPHPFMGGVSPNDARITTWNKPDLKAPLMATIHEGGHAIDCQGVPARFARTPLWGPSGLGIAESQSRLFEIMVGRSRIFWERFFPRAQEYFPNELGDVSVEQFYKAINRVAPSYIRVEADELTYHLHIILRFELEQALVTQCPSPSTTCPKHGTRE